MENYNWVAATATTATRANACASGEVNLEPLFPAPVGEAEAPLTPVVALIEVVPVVPTVPVLLAVAAVLDESDPVVPTAPPVKPATE